MAGTPGPAGSRKRARVAVAVVGRSTLILLTMGALACGDVADDSKLPPDVQDPTTLRTPSGAVARYRGALAVLPAVFDSLLTLTGILTDELAALPVPVGLGQDPYTSIDSRRLGAVGAEFSSAFTGLNRLRGQAREARGFLQAYAPNSSPALAGHMYAVEAYAEVFLADIFCSGIPLSTVNFNGDYTAAAGSTTKEVYEHAVALFDTALTLTSDSVQLQSFAAVGRGRALLALGEYAAAATVVAAVPDGYAYQVTYAPLLFSSERLLQMFADTRDLSPAQGYRAVFATPNMGNGEGLNGLDYRTSGDLRTLATTVNPPEDPTAEGNKDPRGNTFWFPAKYPASGSVTLTVADGIEARLIEAEAALQANDYTAWLAKLNHLRQAQAAWSTIQDCSSGTCLPAAAGPLLPDLVDPGTDAQGGDSLRVDLLFRERAFWLYLTAHRQGDLRRLVRRYSRNPDAVYPTGAGAYPGGSGSYGGSVVAPVPASEQTLNPKYTGCIHQNS